VSPSSLPRRIGALVVAAFLALTVSTLIASPAAAAGVGYVRLAHFVPDGGPCDMYVYLNSLSGDLKITLPGTTYGTLSPYQSLPAGTYAIAMRKPGSAPSSPPALSGQLNVAEGRGYTVTRVGTQSNVIIKTFDDDLAAPDGDNAKVRVIQASLRTLDVSVSNGATLAKDAAFATATNYQPVTPGSLSLRVQPTSGQPTTLRADLVAGNVYSVIVLESAAGPTASLRTDASRAGGVPTGGVQTGAVVARPTHAVPLLVGGSLVALVGAIIFAALARRPRRP
jgi:hypothetical protein